MTSQFSCSAKRGVDSLDSMPPGQLTLLLQRADAGDTQAAERILPLVYDELRKLTSAWQAVRATRAEREQSRLRAIESGLRQSAETQALTMRRRAYASDINLAQRSLAEGDLGRVQELLGRHRPGPGEGDLRGWEWRHL